MSYQDACAALAQSLRNAGFTPGSSAATVAAIEQLIELALDAKFSAAATTPPIFMPSGPPK